MQIKLTRTTSATIAARTMLNGLLDAADSIPITKLRAKFQIRYTDRPRNRDQKPAFAVRCVTVARREAVIGWVRTRLTSASFGLGRPSSVYAGGASSAGSTDPIGTYAVDEEDSTIHSVVMRCP